MIREILFRAKRVQDGRWVQGFYWQSDIGAHYIISKDTGNQGHEIDPRTLGRYTGLRDKNYNMIFEGDTLTLSVELSDGFFDSKMGRHMKQIGADGVSISLFPTNTLSVSYEATLTKTGIPISENEYFLTNLPDGKNIWSEKSECISFLSYISEKCLIFDNPINAHY